MDSRNRSLTQSTTYGVVYTMSNGFYEVLGTSTPVIAYNTSFDYFHKKARADGSLPCSPCVITKAYNSPLFFNRDVGTFRFAQYAVTFPMIPVTELNTVRPAPGTPQRDAENVTLALKLLASTNPLRAEFSIPVFIRELVEMATFFRINVASMAGYVGSSYLTYKFSWTQLYRDIQKLSKITLAIERRVLEFQALEKKGGLRRNGVFLDSKSSKWDGSNITIHSEYGTIVKCGVKVRNTVKVTGSVRWRYKPGYDIDLYKLQGFNRAALQAFDLDNLDSKAVWNMIPFSWLVDYLVSLSDWLGAQEGGVFLEPYDICIVRRGKSRSTEVVTSKPSNLNTSGTSRRGIDSYERDFVTLGQLTLPRVSFFTKSEALTVTALIASFVR